MPVSCGWEPVQNWPCVYWQPVCPALLVVYVDELKLVAKRKDVAGFWKALRKKIKLEAPTPPMRRIECGVETLRPLLQLKPECLTRGAAPAGVKTSTGKPGRKAKNTGEIKTPWLSQRRP